MASLFLKDTLRQLKAYTSLFKKIGEQTRLVQIPCSIEDPQLLILETTSEDTHSSVIYSLDCNTNILLYLESITFIGKETSFSNLKQNLEQKHFAYVDKVTDIGEYTVAGDTIHFWSPLYESPIRISFFGEKLESIDSYDELYGNTIHILYLAAIGDIGLVEDRVDLEHVKVHKPFEKNICKTILIFSHKDSNVRCRISFDFTIPPLFFSRLDILESEVEKQIENNGKIIIYTRHKDSVPTSLKKYISEFEFHSGFISKSMALAVYTDRELFGSVFLSTEGSKSDDQLNRYLSAFEGEIEIGEYLVHEDHGIGQYNGIKQEESLGVLRDFLILEYASKDMLYVPLNQASKLTKYIGSGDIPPVLTRLGKKEWENVKKKVYRSVGILASSLVEHFAKRSVSMASKMCVHQKLESQFAQSFEYEETKDQLRTIKEVLNDLENETPMNRTLIGDVGFGKTEVAMRAAFRTIINGRQVIILCPTTVLVSQHYQVFKERFKDFPIEIKTLSRFNTRSENLKIVEELNNGTVDLVIGTHRLLGNDLKLKHLGLLIIDEEQKFGVRQKEKIKQIEYGVHLLMMSATPIPRSLSISLSGIYDISLITTPPPGRKNIDTILNPFTYEKAVTAIIEEVQRGGQVYFVHNNVRTIESLKSKLQTLLPHIKFVVAHGQMPPKKLDEVMHRFYEHSYDVLISTTIIENGLDIKNVNTMIIHQAQNFGLSQLYQLRGRVGRSNRQAFCYLFYTNKALFKKEDTREESIPMIEPKKKREEQLEAMRMRLTTMVEAKDLGSGFTIASRDLEIRGAGNLLGNQQHGHISAVGFGLYSKLLAQAVERYKQSLENDNFKPIL